MRRRLRRLTRKMRQFSERIKRKKLSPKKIAKMNRTNYYDIR